jgi:hypothetical protein
MAPKGSTSASTDDGDESRRRYQSWVRFAGASQFRFRTATALWEPTLPPKFSPNWIGRTAVNFEAFKKTSTEHTPSHMCRGSVSSKSTWLYLGLMERDCFSLCFMEEYMIKLTYRSPFRLQLKISRDTN